MERETLRLHHTYTTQTALQLQTVLILWIYSSSGTNLTITLLPPLELVEERLTSWINLSQNLFRSRWGLVM